MILGTDLKIRMVGDLQSAVKSQGTLSRTHERVETWWSYDPTPA